jgi:hypothetical protein
VRTSACFCGHTNVLLRRALKREACTCHVYTFILAPEESNLQCSINWQQPSSFCPEAVPGNICTREVGCLRARVNVWAQEGSTPRPCKGYLFRQKVPKIEPRASKLANYLTTKLGPLQSGVGPLSYHQSLAQGAIVIGTLRTSFPCSLRMAGEVLVVVL